MRSKPEKLVLDPFAGQTTTAVAAVLEGQRFPGVEVWPGAFSLRLERLKDLVSKNVTTEHTRSAGP